MQPELNLFHITEKSCSKTIYIFSADLRCSSGDIVIYGAGETVDETFTATYTGRTGNSYTEVTEFSSWNGLTLKRESGTISPSGTSTITYRLTGTTSNVTSETSRNYTVTFGGQSCRKNIVIKVPSLTCESEIEYLSGEVIDEYLRIEYRNGPPGSSSYNAIREFINWNGLTLTREASSLNSLGNKNVSYRMTGTASNVTTVVDTRNETISFEGLTCTQRISVKPKNLCVFLDAISTTRFSRGDEVTNDGDASTSIEFELRNISLVLTAASRSNSPDVITADIDVLTFFHTNYSNASLTRSTSGINKACLLYDPNDTYTYRFYFKEEDTNNADDYISSVTGGTTASSPGSVTMSVSNRTLIGTITSLNGVEVFGDGYKSSGVTDGNGDIVANGFDYLSTSPEVTLTSGSIILPEVILWFEER